MKKQPFSMIAASLALAAILVLPSCTGGNDNPRDDEGDDTTDAITTLAAESNDPNPESGEPTSGTNDSEQPPESATPPESGGSTTEDPTVNPGTDTLIYRNDNLSFCYPATLVMTEIGEMVTFMPENAGNNIILNRIPANPLFSTLDEELFNTLLLPTLEAQGLTVSDLTVEQPKTEDGATVSMACFTSTMANTIIHQTIYIVSSGEYQFMLTVSETTEERDLANSVFASLKVLIPPAQKDPVGGEGDQTFNNSEISFRFPEGMAEEVEADTHTFTKAATGSMINLVRTDYMPALDIMSEEAFETLVFPMLEAQGLTINNPVIDRMALTGGGEVNRLCFSTTTEGITLKFRVYLFSAGESSYIAQIMTMLADEELINTFEASLTILLPPTQGTPSLPGDRQLFENDFISFTYPAGWEADSIDSIGVLTSPDGMSNITVESEAYTDLYKNLTEETFNEVIRPQIESAAEGMTVELVDIVQVETEDGKAPFTVIRMNATMYGVSVSQAVIMVPVKPLYNIGIVITEMTPQDGLVDLVLQSVQIK